MKTIAIAALLFLSISAQAQLDQILKSRSSSDLGNDKIVAGLKQALQVSTGNAVAVTGKPDGFLKNQAIKIPLPPKLETAGKGMRMIGMGAQVDALEVGMNRAAEQATPKAKQIFLDAVRKMSFDDARKILTGSDTAATEYFKRQSSGELTTAFNPIVQQSMQNVGVVQQYDRVVQSAPGGGALAGKFDLTAYVVGKTLDGLFYMLGEEEKKFARTPLRKLPLCLRKFSATSET